VSDVARQHQTNNPAPTQTDHLPGPVVGRRRLLQIGGLGVTAAALAACGKPDDAGLARVGNAPTTTALPEPVVNDAVLMRTASSVERSIASVYDRVIGNPDLLDPAHDDLATRLRDDHLADAATFERLTADLGADPWTCTNPRIDDFVIGPVFETIDGAPATEDSEAIPPTDDAKRDVLNFLHALESMAGASNQAFVQLLSQASLRRESVIVGARHVRRAALLALVITGRPEGYVAPAEEPADPPPIPHVYAIPSDFAALGAQQIVLGAPNESDVRQTFTLDTPSLNTFVYEYMTPGC
jgi:hypothetical protein